MVDAGGHDQHMEMSFCQSGGKTRKLLDHLAGFDVTVMAKRRLKTCDARDREHFRQLIKWQLFEKFREDNDGSVLFRFGGEGTVASEHSDSSKG
jgi:hypothetical protein